MTAYELSQLLLALPAEQQQLQVGLLWSSECEGRYGLNGIRQEKVKIRASWNTSSDDNDDPTLGPVGSSYIELF